MLKNKKVFILNLILSLLISCFIGVGCITDNSSTLDTVKQPSAPVVDSGTLYSLTVAYQMQKDVVTFLRLSRPIQPQITIASKTPAYAAIEGWSPAPSPAGNSTTHEIKIQAALFKKSNAGLAKNSASTPKAVLSNDSSWFTKSSSTLDSTLWIHTYNFSDSMGIGTGCDSIVYAAPYSVASASVLENISVRTYATGKSVTANVMDDDGKPILNEAPVGGVVKLKKQWITRMGDTTWKTIVYTTHGQTTFYDSLGAGKSTAWTDSILVNGKIIWWDKIKDGDNDGFVLTHAGIGSTKVIRESFVQLSNGNFRVDYETLGAGMDEDYLVSADNERFSATSSIIGADGKDKMSTTYSDLDGDGFLWNSSFGAKNQIVIKNIYSAHDSVTTHTDSIIETIPSSGKLAEAKIDFFQSKLKYKDGTESYIRTKASKGSFTMNDSITIWNHRSYVNYLPKNNNDSLKFLDSTLHVVWVVPNDLTNSEDDKILKWFSQSFYKAGQGALSIDEVFTPSKALAKNESASAGTSILETNLASTTNTSVTRKVLYRTFDPTNIQKDWKEIQYFENGDSAITLGSAINSGPQTYTKVVGNNLKNSGIADSKTGSFKDTLKILDANGKTISEEYYVGLLNPITGIGEFEKTIAREGKNLNSHFKVTSNTSSGLQIQKTGDADSALILLSGDSAKTTINYNGVKNVFTGFSQSEGVYHISLTSVAAKNGAQISQGSFNFGHNGMGTGNLTQYELGKTTQPAHVGFNNDGAIFLNGVKINK